jgi:dTDP-4-dehydrorhamnose reductase
MVVLVTGSNGQLGQSLQFISANYPEIDFVFCDSGDLNICDKSQIESVFLQQNPDYCINAAAYTAVDKAESEPGKAHHINHTGARNLAEVCNTTNTILVHVSTDFVFDGSKNSPYNESDTTNPQSIYGLSKLDGENAIRDNLKQHYIIRTSWVYSQFGHNFMKTMLRLANERDTLSVVSDQVGTPTNAADLAEVLIKIVEFNCKNPKNNAYGTYNFSNEGQCSWFDFAKKIFEIHKIEINLQPILTINYPTPAKRPKYSVLDKNKIKMIFGITIKSWEDSLKQTILI